MRYYLPHYFAFLATALVGLYGYEVYVITSPDTPTAIVANEDSHAALVDTPDHDCFTTIPGPHGDPVSVQADCPSE